MTSLIAYFAVVFLTIHGCVGQVINDRGPWGVIVTPKNIPADNGSPTTTTSRPPVTTTRPTTVIHDTTELFPTPGSNDCGLHYPNKIIGGSVAALDEHPWLARLEYTYTDSQREFRCAGSLINSRYVLTAGQCVPTASDDFTLTGVRLGEWNAATSIDCIGVTCADPPQDIAVQEVITHPDYDSNSVHHDIALVRLRTPAQYSGFVRPICLPSTQELRRATDFSGKIFEVSGWGATEEKDVSDIKLKVVVTGVGLDTCNWIWRETNDPITDRQICAGGDTNKGSCRGDSGGPLMLVHKNRSGHNFLYVAGIVSYGTTSCAMQNWPAVYTNVGSYMDWIETSVRF